jgi:hypothetical protein
VQGKRRTLVATLTKAAALDIPNVMMLRCTGPIRCSP